MDITDLIKKEQQAQDKEQQLQDLGMPEPSFFMIPEDAGFLSDIDELTRLLHKNFVEMYSKPSTVNDETIKKNGSMLAMLDKYIDTRRNIYMLTKTKVFR